MKIVKRSFSLFFILLFFFGCNNQIITYSSPCTDLSKAGIPFYPGMGTSTDPNQFGYIWSTKENRIEYIRNEDLEKNLQHFFPFAKIQMVDGTYALVDDYWFYEIYTGVLKKKLPPYSNLFDCDNFSMSTALFCQWLHNYTKMNGCDAVAVGELYYFINGDKKRGHAINIILHKKDGQFYYSFFNAQNNEKISLTEKEKLSVNFIKF